MNRGEAIIWDTGGDGSFSIEVRLGNTTIFSPEKMAMVDMKSLGYHLFATSSVVCLGSPECVGSVESDCLEKNLCQFVPGVEASKYEADVYFLVDSRAIVLAERCPHRA